MERLAPEVFGGKLKKKEGRKMKKFRSLLLECRDVLKCSIHCTWIMYHRMMTPQYNAQHDAFSSYPKSNNTKEKETMSFMSTSQMINDGLKAADFSICTSLTDSWKPRNTF
ncbi:hypothetical protein CEXT_774071 [Caerostris extrusa]|uniref:Uncharacterized protein n=1 Tax=Caerostris extrusa TaxID=172846 RepID=A0AAV4NGC4_CAEEX|nr:hypothetical protein CEXT_774071 [Caerostris extrusa]